MDAAAGLFRSRPGCPFSSPLALCVFPASAPSVPTLPPVIGAPPRLAPCSAPASRSPRCSSAPGGRRLVARCSSRGARACSASRSVVPPGPPSRSRRVSRRQAVAGFPAPDRRPCSAALPLSLRSFGRPPPAAPPFVFCACRLRRPCSRPLRSRSRTVRPGRSLASLPRSPGSASAAVAPFRAVLAASPPWCSASPRTRAAASRPPVIP